MWSKTLDIVVLMLVCDFKRLEPLLNEWSLEDFDSILSDVWYDQDSKVCHVHVPHRLFGH